IGAYSDVSANGTVGQTFLRGDQATDANGLVTFTTIYPGWYSGRAVHIHLRARVYDAAGNTTYNFTTQLFFDDTVTDTVFASGPYNSRGTRDTRNA
ncbi:intradiol ring-cleavage dioxygenase, partial [Salmonella enterica]